MLPLDPVFQSGRAIALFLIGEGVDPKTPFLTDAEKLAVQERYQRARAGIPPEMTNRLTSQ